MSVKAPDRLDLKILDVLQQDARITNQALADLVALSPSACLARVRALGSQLGNGERGQLMRLAYAGDSAFQPILSHLIRDLGLELSILHGQIDEIQDQPFGSLAVFASGAAEQIQSAVAHLRQHGVQVEEVPSKD